MLNWILPGHLRELFVLTGKQYWLLFLKFGMVLPVGLLSLAVAKKSQIRHYIWFCLKSFGMSVIQLGLLCFPRIPKVVCLKKQITLRKISHKLYVYFWLFFLDRFSTSMFQKLNTVRFYGLILESGRMSVLSGVISCAAYRKEWGLIISSSLVITQSDELLTFHKFWSTNSGSQLKQSHEQIPWHQCTHFLFAK